MVSTFFEKRMVASSRWFFVFCGKRYFQIAEIENFQSARLTYRGNGAALDLYALASCYLTVDNTVLGWIDDGR